MSDEAPPKKDEDGGAPAWVMTFADLMSLLMCFFVLLLSFSEIDLQKYKQIAGSMKMAFGVQRDINVKEMPKGTSVIAREFSPGKPTPTPINEVRQQTIDETKQTLEFTDATSEENSDGSGTDNDNIEIAPIQKQNDSTRETEEKLEYELNALSELVTELKQDMQQIAADVASDLSSEQQEELEKAQQKLENIDEKVAEVIELEETLEAREVIVEPSYEQTNEDANKLLQALAPEIKKGLVEIETENNKIILRIKEKGSFPSGSSTMKGGFMPVIKKLRTALTTIEGKLIVSGHTDNIPINTARFRSNWELSSSRAVTVVHEILKGSKLNSQRFTVEGRGDAFPLVPNDTAENRAINRRVELLIIQNDGDQINDVTAENDLVPTVEEDLEPAKEKELEATDISTESTEKKDLQKSEIINTTSLKSRIGAISESLKKQK